MSYWRSFFCTHNWIRYGSGYDSYVKCAKCGKIKEEESGDVSSY